MRLFTFETDDSEEFGAVLEFLADRDARLGSAAKAWSGGTVWEADPKPVTSPVAEAEAVLAAEYPVIPGPSQEELDEEFARAAAEAAVRNDPSVPSVKDLAEQRELRDPFAAPPEFRQGLYAGEDGETFYVYKAQAGHWLAKRVVQVGTKVSLEYAGAAGRFADPANRLSDQEHTAIGRMTHWCGFCGTGLDRKDSQELGYGPTCAARNGLPHPYNGS